MKKLYILLLPIIVLLSFSTCGKEENIPFCNVEVKDEVVVDNQSAFFSGSYSWLENRSIPIIEIAYSTSSSMKNPEVIKLEVEGRNFNFNLENLKSDTKYYYQYIYKNGVNELKSQVFDFQTTNHQNNSQTEEFVTTFEVSDIKATSATCGGDVLSKYAVSERGLCYGTSANPTIANNKVKSGNGTGSFSTSITGLQPKTTYYVRAYAINPTGTFYGHQRSFITSSGVPTFGASTTSNITQTQAYITGIVNDDGGDTITEKGVCYATSVNPTVSNNKLMNVSGIGSYICIISYLQPNTTYYVRPYVINSTGTYYGSQISFTTEGQPIVNTEGALLGVFSVSNTKQVVFSQGNLQYQASTDTWRFAENQYDYVGSGNINISGTYSGWIDLFGWGTGKNPTNASRDYEDYSTFEDWGVNKISNGGNQVNLWRALTKDEWSYLLYGRINASSKKGVACVNGINGLVLLPDEWALPSGAYFTSGLASNSGFEFYQTVNAYTISEWEIMESAGAVFLPAAGYRQGTSMYGVGGTYGHYWSSTYYNSYSANYVYFDSGGLNSSSYGNCSHGRSVRLCKEINY